ncbi:hypothetical protein Taro_029353 [Colocasia esculenta]|uniref:RING-CH-type domain-containing protein n=1 Tax=Colocasia esculenta TaxID=4460 RepID=A0A843VNU1_COLES|nr:hypothetical protein [Colocasia esculenta]
MQQLKGVCLALQAQLAGAAAPAVSLPREQRRFASCAWTSLWPPRTLGVQRPATLAELLSIAQCHAACEESLAASRAEQGEQSDKKRPSDNGSDRDLKKGRRNGDSSRRPRPFTNYTPLTVAPEQILAEIRNEAFVRWLQRMRSDPRKRDQNKYCRFHCDHGHDTSECRQLKDEIEDLIKRGYLGRFVGRNEERPRRRDRTPEQPINNEPNGQEINVIAGGFGAGGESTRSRRNYARRYAHRKCVQRWCNEKGDIVCEICLQQFKPGYTAPPLFHYGGIPMNFRGNWEISRRDLHNPRFIALVAADRNFGDADYDDYSTSGTRSMLYCRSVAAIVSSFSLTCFNLTLNLLGTNSYKFMILLVLRHTLPIIIREGDVQYSLSEVVLLVLRIGGILLPVYIMIRALALFHHRRRQQAQGQSINSSQSGSEQQQPLPWMQPEPHLIRIH